MKIEHKGRNCMRIAAIVLLSFWMTSQVVSAEKSTTSGILVEDEVWSGNIHLTGDVVIPSGITLVVLAGTAITFTPNQSDYDAKLPLPADLGKDKCNLLVQGNLRIEGEKDKLVTVGELVYDVERRSKISWGGIIFGGVNGTSIVRYAKISYADVGLVFVGSSSPKIVASTITENDVGVMIFGFSSPRINENKIHHNTLWAVSCYDYSSPIISKNSITANLVGIGSQDFSSPTISYNTLSDNEAGILLQDSSGSSVLNNYFQNNTQQLRDDRES
jgi:parallel beta-helix repeat protein